MEAVLKKYFGDQVKMDIVSSDSDLGELLRKIWREHGLMKPADRFYDVTIGGGRFVLLMVREEDRTDVRILRDVANALFEATMLNAAFLFETFSPRRREALIRAGIPFVAKPEQIYLPFMGMVLSGRYPAKTTLRKDKMMPATQSLFLYILYCEEAYVQKSEAADALHLTKTSITRASLQLESMGLITQKKQGKSILMYATAKGMRLYRKAKPYLISPIQESAVARDEKTEQLLRSMAVRMAGSSHKTDYAIYKESVGQLALIEVHEEASLWEDRARMLLRLWKYDPTLFARDGHIDPVSAVCSGMLDEAELAKKLGEETKETEAAIEQPVRRRAADVLPVELL